jgi:hypothetical protein
MVRWLSIQVGGRITLEDLLILFFFGVVMGGILIFEIMGVSVFKVMILSAQFVAI